MLNTLFNKMKIYFEEVEHDKLKEVIDIINEEDLLEIFHSNQIFYDFLLMNKENLHKETNKLIDEYSSKKNIKKIVSILKAFIKNKEEIFIIADNDTDGSISVSMFELFNKFLKDEINYSFGFIKNNNSNGLNLEDLKNKIKDLDKKEELLLLVIDNGTNQKEEIKKILDYNKNIEIIIIDHHKATKEVVVENDRLMLLNLLLSDNIVLSASFTFYLILYLYVKKNKSDFLDITNLNKNLLKLGKISNLLDSVKSDFLLYVDKKHIDEVIKFSAKNNIYKNINIFLELEKDKLKQLGFYNVDNLLKEKEVINKLSYDLIKKYNPKYKEYVNNKDYIKEVKIYTFLSFVEGKHLNLTNQILEKLSNVENLIKRIIIQNKDKYIKEYIKDEYKITFIKGLEDFHIPLKFLSKIFYTKTDLSITLYERNNKLQGNIISKYKITDILDVETLKNKLNCFVKIEGHDNASGIEIDNSNEKEVINVLFDSIIEVNSNIEINFNEYPNFDLSYIKYVKKINEELNVLNIYSYNVKCNFILNEDILFNDGEYLTNKLRNGEINNRYIFNKVKYNCVASYEFKSNKYYFKGIKFFDDDVYIPDEDYVCRFFINNKKIEFKELKEELNKQKGKYLIEYKTKCGLSERLLNQEIIEIRLSLIEKSSKNSFFLNKAKYFMNILKLNHNNVFNYFENFIFVDLKIENFNTPIEECMYKENIKYINNVFQKLIFNVYNKNFKIEVLRKINKDIKINKKYEKNYIYRYKFNVKNLLEMEIEIFLNKDVSYSFYYYIKNNKKHNNYIFINKKVFKNKKVFDLLSKFSFYNSVLYSKNKINNEEVKKQLEVFIQKENIYKKMKLIEETLKDEIIIEEIMFNTYIKSNIVFFINVLYNLKLEDISEDSLDYILKGYKKIIISNIEKILNKKSSEYMSDKIINKIKKIFYYDFLKQRKQYNKTLLDNTIKNIEEVYNEVNKNINKLNWKSNLSYIIKEEELINLLKKG